MDQEQSLQRPLHDGSLRRATATTSPSQPDTTLPGPEHQPPPPLEPSPDDNTALQFGHKSCPPPAYTQSFPDTPNTELPPIQPQSDAAASANHTLPSLSSVTGPQIYGSPRTAESSYSPEPLGATSWPSMNPLTTFYAPSHVQDSPQRMDVDVGSNGRASSVSLDDPDVRMAAEALGDLRADFVSSPPKRNTPLPSTPNGPEPLFSLLTTSHPLIANTIDTASKAYTTSKKTYPRFKSGAEYVEGYLSPVANTVGSVGRATGVHGGIRWFLGAGRRHGSSSDHLESGSRKSQKRRKMDNKQSGEQSQQSLDALADKAAAARPIANHDLYDFTRDRRNSISTVDTQDTLPAYDDTGRSPAYSDAPEPQNQVAKIPNASAANGPWQQRLIMSTSGLSIAMSKESLRSLKYCLQWLRWANEHIAKTIAALKSILQQYDGSSRTNVDDREGDQDQEMANATETASTEDRTQLAARITELKGDVLKTLRDVIDTVSKYAGGALPDNARVLVHRHLTSLPQRFRVATLQDASAKKQGNGAEEQEVRDSAQRVLVLAKEGLDMMEQVSGVLDGTIHSAEEWCQRLGKGDDGKKDEARPVDTKEKSDPLVRTQHVPGAFPTLPTVQ
ncbi:transcription factor Opi1-domain-containing protein [Coniochaeta sp. 2T2.1]|nr:transcription factor Opi1-domain-containing protein [Coniochaeta sp. 2T2.1]